MRPSGRVVCFRLTGVDVDLDLHSVPSLDIPASRVSVVIVLEAAASRIDDGFYSSDGALFARTTLEAFHDAGADVASVAELVRRGIYLTTAVKCA